MWRHSRNRRFLNASAGLLAVAIVGFAFEGGRGPISNSLVAAARAQSSIPENFEKIKEKIRKDKENLDKLIARWRGDLPEGLAKTNGRIEATEIDVASKYAGRLEAVMVDEGDQVQQAQVVARIDSPEYQAQLQTAQANVLVAKETFASAEAKVAQARADLIYAKGDLAGC